jgi:hypothetical protein
VDFGQSVAVEVWVLFVYLSLRLVQDVPLLVNLIGAVHAERKWMPD